MPPHLSTFRSVAGFVVAGALLTACASAATTSQASNAVASATPVASLPDRTPAATASASPTAAVTPTPSASERSVIVTLLVADEQEYRVQLTDPADIATARELLAGDEVLATIPNGRIVRGDPGVNAGYSWSIDPGDFEWAEVTIEVCDGLPSHVEDGTLSGPRFCPWQAEVIDIQPAP